MEWLNDWMEIFTKLGLAATPFAAAWLAVETYKINRERRRLEAEDRERFGAAFVEAEMLDFYRNVVRDIRLYHISGLKGERIDALEARLEAVDHVIRAFATYTDKNSKVWGPWTKFRFNFEEFLRAIAPRAYANATVKNFKTENLDPHLIKALTAVRPKGTKNWTPDQIRGASIEPVGEKEIVEVGFDGSLRIRSSTY